MSESNEVGQGGRGDDEWLEGEWAFDVVRGAETSRTDRKKGGSKSSGQRELPEQRS